MSEYMYDSCDVFQSTGVKANSPEEECNVCPFREDCPYDVFDGAVRIVTRSLGKYFKTRNNT